MTDSQISYRWLPDDGPAFGAPGLAPRWTSSRKDAVCTAYSTASRVWFTVSHGTMNEIYYPTVDRPQTRDMELLFTDGETFFHEEKRDFNPSFRYLDPEALAIETTATDPTGRYTVRKQFFSDPHHAAVIMQVQLEAAPEFLARLRCYVLLAPHLNGGGAHNNGRSVDIAGQRTLVAWRDNVALALGVSSGFTRSSCGFVGSSDGYQDLAENMRMDWQFGEALDGNIALTGEVDLARGAEFTVSIGFGATPHSALTRMMQCQADPVALHRARFIEQWKRTGEPLSLASASTDGGVLSRISQNVILAHEDKRYSGAFIASASIPWGASKGDDDLGGYHLVWTRDMVQSATALLACNRPGSAARALVYLACSQRADGGFPQNFWIDGEPYWSGIQLDEVAFPIILAWKLWKAGQLPRFDPNTFVERAAAFLIRYAPITQQERWEENAGYSPSTLAVVISALLCAADLARVYGEPDRGSFLQDYADWIEAHLDEWTTTDDGVLHPEVKRHYMRIRPPAAGERFHNPEIPPGHIRIANRGPDEQSEFEARAVVDQGFLELVRYGVRRADDPLIVDSLKVVDFCLKHETPVGPAWRRYNHDGYGQQKDGGPYMGYGQGRCWPLLGGERAHFELSAGRDPRPLITAYERFSSAGGMLPEQVWDHADLPGRGLVCGQSAGSAQPLVWAHAEYIKLLRSVTDGHVFDRISVVEERYGKPVGQRSFESTIEIYQQTRPISSLPAGHTLRLIDPAGFRAVWSLDGWATVQTTDSTPVGSAGHFLDIPTGSGDQGKSIAFTIFWPEFNKWLGSNLSVAVTAPLGTEQHPTGESTKPQN